MFALCFSSRENFAVCREVSDRYPQSGFSDLHNVSVTNVSCEYLQDFATPSFFPKFTVYLLNCLQGIPKPTNCFQ